MDIITDADDRTHVSDGDPHWQESWVLTFYDPISRVAGYYHTGLRAGDGQADVWVWVTHKGDLVETFNDLHLPYPTDDYSDLHIGPLHIRSLVPNLKRDVAIDGKRVKGTLTYEAFAKKPLTISAPSDSSWAKEQSGAGHYETIGRISGTLEIDGVKVQVNGQAFDDRSWGRRTWANLHYRVTWASFGPDLYLIAYHVATDAGGQSFGWVNERGVIRTVTKASFTVEVRDDCLSARSVNTRLWTEDGSGLEYDLLLDGHGVVTQRDGFMASPALGVAKMGGRLGVGLLEFSEMKRPTPEIAAKYGLDMRPFP